MFIWLCADTLSFYNSGIFLISIMWQIMSRPAGIDLGEIYIYREFWAGHCPIVNLPFQCRTEAPCRPTNVAQPELLYKQGNPIN